MILSVVLAAALYLAATTPLFVSATGINPDFTNGAATESNKGPVISGPEKPPKLN